MITADSEIAANNCIHDFVLIYCNTFLSMAMDVNSLKNASIVIYSTEGMSVAMLLGCISFY